MTSCYLADPDPDLATRLSAWGYASADDIWRNRQIWSVVGNTVVHFSLTHLAGNVFWLWILSSCFERHFGLRCWLCFYAGACLVSMAGSLVCHHKAGVGASGVLYAFVGFAWISRRRVTTFARTMTRPVSGFLLLTVVCQWLDGIFSGNAVNDGEHFACLAYGALAGGTLVLSRPIAAAAPLGAGLLFCATLLFWCPWSTEWTESRARAAYDAGRLEEARFLVQKSLRMGSDPVWALNMLALIESLEGHANESRQIIERLRLLDPKGAAALEQVLAGSQNTLR